MYPYCRLITTSDYFQDPDLTELPSLEGDDWLVIFGNSSDGISGPNINEEEDSGR